MSDFGKWLLENDIVEEASIRISDCKAAYEAGRKAGLDEAADYLRWAATELEKLK